MSVATVLAGGLVAGVLALPGGTPVRESATSEFGPQQVKTATATCTSGTRYAGGAAINYGMPDRGGVAITAILPDEDGESVTVTARAPAGRTGGWSVTAYVMCESSVTPIRRSGEGVGLAEASCTDTTALFGVGFLIRGGVVRSVVMDPDLHRVSVAADRWSAQVTAYALCRPEAHDRQRVHKTVASGTWPIVATTAESDPETAVYGTGATVTGPPEATLDAIVPGPDNGTTWARGTLWSAAPDASKAFRDEGGAVTVEAAELGTFH